MGDKSTTKRPIRYDFLIPLAVSQVLLGVCIQVSLISRLGYGDATDIFVAAQAIPNIVFAVVVVSFQNIYGPLLSNNSILPERWRYLLGTVHLQLFLVFFAIGVILLFLKKPVFGVVYSGFDPGKREAVEKIFTLLYLASWLNAQNMVNVVALRSRGNFLFAESALIFGSLIIITLLLAVQQDFLISTIGWIFVSGPLICSLPLWYSIGSPKISFRNPFRANPEWPRVKSFLCGSLVYKASPLVDQALLSHAGPGGITLFSLALTANSTLIKVVDKIFVVTALPSIARAVGASKVDFVFQLVRNRAILILAIVFGLIAMMFLFSTGLAQLYAWLFGLTAQASFTLHWLICILFSVFLASSVGALVNGVFFAMGDSGTPTKLGVIGFLVSIPVRLLGFWGFGLFGLAFASAIYYLGNLLLGGFIAYRRLKTLND